MKKNDILGYELLDCKKVKKSTLKKLVRNKMKNEKDEVTVMKMSKMKKLAIAGAVTATTLLSFTTVNAATDGAITQKVSEVLTNIKVTINGKKTEIPATVTKTDDGCVIQFEVDEDDDVKIECYGDDIPEFDEDDDVKFECYGDDIPELAENGGYISGSVVQSDENGTTIESEWKIEDDGTESTKVCGPDGLNYTNNHAVGEDWSGGAAVYDENGNLVNGLYAGSDKSNADNSKEFMKQSEQAKKQDDK